MTTEPDPTPRPADFRILIVDDEAVLRSVIEEFLGMIGYTQLDTAGDGQEALDIIRAHPIDCMISDLRMPKMELEELLGILRVEYPRLTVIATSGYSEFETARFVFERGASDFLGKPLNLDALEETLDWILQRRGVLGLAHRFFAANGHALQADEERRHLDDLAAAVGRVRGGFAGLAASSVRIAGLARQLDLGLEAPIQLDVELAALLHETGASTMMQHYCRQPRRLEEKELEFVRGHARLSARLAADALGREEFGPIIAAHPAWQNADAAAPGQDIPRPAVWLGLLNAVEGWLHDRPDRPAVSSGRLREILAREHKERPRAPLALLLDQWTRVEAYYAAPLTYA